MDNVILVDSKKKVSKIKQVDKHNPFKPTAAFIGASWMAFFAGVIAFNIGF